MQSLQKRAHKQLIAADFLEQRVYKEASAVRRGRARSPACLVARSRARSHARPNFLPLKQQGDSTVGQPAARYGTSVWQRRGHLFR
jgi:hypothetical protein